MPGAATVQFAIIGYIVLSTQSGVYVMLSTLYGFLPQIVVALFAGIAIEHCNRKKLIISADAVIAGTFAADEITAAGVVYGLLMTGIGTASHFLFIFAVQQLDLYYPATLQYVACHFCAGAIRTEMQAEFCLYAMCHCRGTSRRMVVFGPLADMFSFRDTVIGCGAAPISTTVFCAYLRKISGSAPSS